MIREALPFYMLSCNPKPLSPTEIHGPSWSNFGLAGQVLYMYFMSSILSQGSLVLCALMLMAVAVTLKT
jgi:hypothetical protein